jgi:hypothetical protein
MQHNTLVAVLVMSVLACKKQEPAIPSPAQTQQTRPSPQEAERALAAVKDCLSTVGENIAYWTDAVTAATGMEGSKVEALCSASLMKTRHLISILNSCHELVEKAKAFGSLKEDLAVADEQISNGIKGYKTLLAPEDKIMILCKKWSEQLLVKPIEEPPKTSIPDGRCPTYGQILRDARNRYNSICRYLGDCSRKLQVSDRVADPYDKTRCDTSVKIGKEPVFISALYRRSGDNWQLEGIR